MWEEDGVEAGLDGELMMSLVDGSACCRVAVAAAKPADCVICQRPGTETILQQIETDSALLYSRTYLTAVNVDTSHLVASVKQLAVLMQTALIAASTT